MAISLDLSEDELAEESELAVGKKSYGTTGAPPGRVRPGRRREG